MTNIVQIVLFACIAGQKFVNAEEADYTFRSYCNHPANFGEGKFDKEKMLCTITYNVTIKKPESAFNFCDRQHPYYLSSYEVKGSQVICKIKSHYKCETTEILIGNKCFYPRKSSKFTKEECGRRYRLHVVSSIFEQKWISAFMSSYNMMWVGNDAMQLKNVQVAVHKDKVIHGVAGHVIQRNARETLAIVTSRGLKNVFPIGHLTYVTKETYLPLLCSRDADVLGSYAEAMIEKLNEIGIRSYIYTDSEGKSRPFFIPRELISFEIKDESSVSARRHHEICKIFYNGYAATPFDFKNIGDFKSMLRLEKVNIVATPGQAEIRIENRRDCLQDSGYKSRRGHYKVKFTDGSSRVCGDRIWRDSYPSRTCADTPRIALGFSQEGLVDIPAFARLFAICTFGRPFKSSSSGMEEQCHNLARYDNSRKQCVCNNASNDILDTKLFDLTSIEKQSLPGTLCLDCEDKPSHDAAIVYEFTGRIYASNLKWILTNLLFSFAKTSSTVALMGFGCGGVTRFEGIFESSPTKYNYKHWQSWGMRYIDSEIQTCGKDSKGNPHLALERVYNYDFLQNRPPHKRLLIFMTTGNHEDETKLLYWINKFKEMSTKIISMGYELSVKELRSYASDDDKAISLGYEGVYRAVTYVDQILAKDVCLRI